MLAFATIGLLSYHLALISRGQTTFEGVDDDQARFSEGCRQNCYEACCGPTPPPYVDFTETVELAARREPPEIVRMCNPPWMVIPGGQESGSAIAAGHKCERLQALGRSLVTAMLHSQV